MPTIKSLDLEVDEHRKYLRRQIASIKRSDPKSGKNYEAFIGKLMVLFSDNPPTSWRFVIASDRQPTFRVYNRKSGRVRDFLRVFPKWGMSISPSLTDPRFRKLFPKQNAWYNSGDSVYFDFSTFGDRKQKEYIEGIRAILAANTDITVNFAAHISVNKNPHHVGPAL